MQRDGMKDLLWFVAVARERSFTRAAAKLGTSQSTLSHTIKELEARLGVRLLTRTTRSVAPTEAGERLYQSLVPRFEEIEADLASLVAFRDKPSGTVRITLSDHALQSTVWPRLEPVLRDYPDLNVELYSDNGMRNIVEERFDAGVRLGESIDKDMIAVRIGPDWRLVAVASPDYFSRRPAPRTPQDLVGHDCINLRLTTFGGLYAWEFAKGGRDLRVRVEGQLTFNSTIPMVDAAISGSGIAYVPESLVSRHIAEGRLTLVLGDWSPPFAGYHLYYPSRRLLSPALAVIVDALRHRS
ncbi:MAG: LysR family transcriptional regulator [Mesorhizobium sp.]|uniref:LysR family transcriptional regulator n=1 Tax=unclassified Mesorhizobium TaxID=325217 RepID=UPI000F758C91|nr:MULTISPECIES: LysR family transcriptional regulator [unclassified Mesorhizobium]AZO50614.1 LysR family transcriptional regulator [Mesorhizobium sp. M4B.F.Ca.ET.058.02.1.1]RVD37651.1 LysR family transcriptional regulator [Mesorhizobium sp. M4A.F.Ca.ET.020.02.1.1]RWC21440.1 MAG: LysR family transcriptional regulator [Mesorhizobium sp.]RWC42174.1 MAG: LysR family transcriptional regulator [Mesorhizobium sp.]RWD17604.1 MAG: LysR family transcriptional regulator [Mesorhizobium sp.]